ncbi:hypothetical protein TruAng_004471 [Truncatella angustata]|nr:hypothetical protein TruAng_004471 [Truncatella angustata]
MSYYGYTTSHRGHTYGDDAVKRYYRETPRHSHHPTQYIYNDGRLVIDDKSLRNNNSVIYNRPGSTMWVQSTAASQYSSSLSDPYRSGGSWGSTLHICRGCSYRRELTGGYCRSCIDIKLSPRVVEVVREERRLPSAPSRRMLEYYR